ncbi:hypothetical protein KSP40_PGU018291 [Platanthera guangdongensis]|uniref:RNase H type-1 domain-containing protein n=1 Tax=Platanthera guangdongensis TaxID=2320717 RepID=A0ABR2LLN6_9ASPA
MFCWRAVWDALPTWVWLHSRGLAESSLCPWNCGVPRTWTTRLEGASGYWPLDVSYYGGGKDFLRLGTGPISLPWPRKLVRLVWLRHVSFATLSTNVGAAGMRLLMVVRSEPRWWLPSLCCRTLSSLIKVGTRDAGVPPTPRGSFALPCGNPPPLGWIKINVDCSLQASGRAGLGIVIRNEIGRVLMAAVFAWQHWDPRRVEFEAVAAIRRVVQPALRDARGIMIEGDAKNVMEFCSRHAGRTARSLVSPAKDDLSFLSKFSAVRFHCIGRKANRAADFCARLACAGNFFWSVGDDMDGGFLALAAEDSRGWVGWCVRG